MKSYKYPHSSQKTRFGVFVDETKVTSGQRFWCALAKELEPSSVSMRQKPSVILFNISAPLMRILRAKLMGCKVVLRVDGLYADRLSEEFLSTFRPVILRYILRVLSKLRWTRTLATDIANVLNRNYGAFARIFFANCVVYQSEFSKKCYERYFPYKPNTVILNGTRVRFDNEFTTSGERNEIRLVTIFSSWMLLKRMGEIVRFVHYTREKRGLNIHLTILGYNENVRPVNFTQDDVITVRTSNYIATTPPFNLGDFSVDIASIMKNAHAFIWIAYRDCCPNAVIEAMSFGLPLVGVASGGVPEIVEDAGVLLECNDFSEGFHVSHRFEGAFPVLDYDALLTAVIEVASNNACYRERVRKRFNKDLDISVVAKRYKETIRRYERN
ncbi:MAG: glycosyltransferase [Thermodesulfobacteriota bacterium]